MSRDYSLIDPVRGFGAIVSSLVDRVAELERLVSASGAGAKVSYTPNVKFGGAATNVTAEGRFRFDGDWVDVEIMWATTGAPAAGQFTFELPVAPSVSGLAPAGNTFSPTGLVLMIEQGVARRGGYVQSDSTIVSAVIVFTSGAAVSNVVPQTWKNADGGMANIRYRWR